jgi:RHS repeat-associated protein
VNITYIIGRNRISQITVKDNTEQELYFTFDGHGSTRALTDFVGAIVELYAFDAYGNAIGFDPSIALTEFLYSGEQFDSKIGQQYLRARYYDPATGRFNRLDPFFGNLEDPQSLHKYLYAHADPINGIDPSGNMSMSCAIAINIAIGIGVGSSAGALLGYIDARLGGSSHSDAMVAAGWGALIGGVAGAILGPLGYVAMYGYGISQAIAYSIIIQAEFIGSALGVASVFEAFYEGKHAQGVFRAITTLFSAGMGLRALASVRLRNRSIGDFSNIKGKSVPDILEAVPPSAEKGHFNSSTTGGAQEGVKYKWTDSSGVKWEMRIHDPDPSAPIGSNASNGWIVRVKKGRNYMDHDGNFYHENIDHLSSPYYNPQAINDTHIPIKTPDFFDLFK